MPCFPRPTALTSLVALGLVALMVAPARAADLASEWQQGHNVRTRLIAGHIGTGARPLAGLQVALSPGWKTYWRNPGDAGGVPPYFTFDGSSNLKSARVLYPSPHRLADASGVAVGYKGEVVFPIEVEAVDPALPVGLKVNLEYGVCREICIPAEAHHTLSLPQAPASPAPEALASALRAVPVVVAAGGGGGEHLPRIAAVKAVLDGSAPTLSIDVTYPAGVDGADLLLEAPDGIYVPLPKPDGPAKAGTVRYSVDISSGGDAKALKGKTLTATSISTAGSSETAIKLP